MQKTHNYYTTLMLMDTAIIRKYFVKLGLAPEIADIYLSLYSDGPQSISALSRNSGVERTRIYRLIDQLLQSNLVETETRQRGAVIKAAPISNLQTLIDRRTEELKNLGDELDMMERLLARNSLSNPALRVQTYRGQQGVRQMLNNELSAGDIVGYGLRATEANAGRQFLNDWRKRLQNAVRERLLVNPGDDPADSAARLDYRVISVKTLGITGPVAIYDDVVAYYSHKENEVFGLEIISADFSAMQRQQFECLWNAANPKDPKS